MSSKIVNKAVTLSTRKYAAVATKAAAQEGLKVTKLNSGAVVASIEDGSVLSRISVYFKGGARYNTFPGACTALRGAATTIYSNTQHTGLHLVRTLEQTGAPLNVAADRELLCYSTQCSRDDVTVPLYTLANVSSNDAYRVWELPSELEVARLSVIQDVSPQEAVLDLAAKAAFRSHPLGNPKAVPDFLLHKYNAENLNTFVRHTHGRGQMVVVGSGVDHETLVDAADALGVGSPSVGVAAAPATYLGGDVRQESAGDLAHVVVCGEGCGMASSDRLATMLAGELLCHSAAVKYSNGASLLHRVAGDVAFSGAAVTEFYEDAGLLGFQVSTPASEVAGLVSAAVTAFKALVPTDADVAAAKNRLEARLRAEDTQAGYVESVGRQLALTGEVQDLEDTLKALQTVSVPAVAKVIKKAFSGKLTVAAKGNVNNVPYSDTL